MNCNQINKKLIFYIEKSLTDDEMIQISSHIEECNSCKQISKRLASSFDVIAQERNISVNPFLHTRVFQAIENKKSSTTYAYKASFKKVLQPILYSVILIVGISFGITLGNLATNTTANNFVNNDEIFFNDFEQEPIEKFLLNE